MTGWVLVRERARLSDTTIAMVAVLLALTCLIPLFAEQSWVLPALLVVVVIACLGAVSRALALPIPLVPIVQLIGIVGTLTLVFASETAYGRAFPSSASWDALHTLVVRGMLDAQAFSAPVPTVDDLVLLAAGGAGLVALCVDTLFVSVRSPVLAGAPILVLYAGSAFLQFGRAPWWTFVPASIGWLLLLAADQRDTVREWAGLRPTARIRGLSAIARRVGLAAIAAGLVVGVILPIRSVALPRGAGDGAGGGSTAEGPVLLDPLVSMRRNLTLSNDAEVLRYRTDSPDPTYLRVTALENFDGVTWRQRVGLESGRDPGWTIPGVVQAPGDGRLDTYDVSVTNLDNSYLPLPYPIAEIQNVSGIDSGWHLDPATGVAFSADQAATGANYRVTAFEPAADAATLRGAPLPKGAQWPQLTIPGGMDPTVAATARAVTAGAATPYDEAVALQDWFIRDGGFRYSTSVRSGSDADYIAEFLRDRVGYCEQFAGAMAIMARTLGIPSRVVVGFTQGTLQDDGTWKVTVRDAHAWPELWFEGVGWVRFEPTPRGDATLRAPAYAPIESFVPSRSGDDSRGQLDITGFEPVVVDAGTDYRGIANRIAIAIVIVGGLIAGGWPMLRRVAHRRARLHRGDYAQVVLGSWEEVAATATDLGQPWSAFSTPRQCAERLSRAMSQTGAAALRRLRVQVEQVRYAEPVARRQDTVLAERSAAVRADVRLIVRELRARVRWQTRLQARYWPSSERRRQRSSMRSMKPGDLRGSAEGAAADAASSAGRAPKAE